MNVVEISSLTHRFGAEVVLAGLDLTVPRGAIYGLLGPNGAGKTTTLRLILGLLRRQHGTIRVFGQTIEDHRIEILHRVGSCIESPSLYGHLTATENLEVWRRVYRCRRSRIPEALRLVDLADTGNKRADQFSLGMRQRLALAVALLHEPSLVILDEPTNGLDPQGILDMRQLLAELNREHSITILVSSHILAEIERTVSHVAVLHRGRLRFQGTLDDLRARQTSGSFTMLDTSDSRAAFEVARAAGLVPAEVAADGPTGAVHESRLILPPLSRIEAGRLTAQIAQAGISLYAISTVQPDLEQIFLDLVSEDA